MEEKFCLPQKSFISDEPEVEKDYFKRRPFAQQISDIIASRKEPSSIVVGIYGEWGEGKTTVLNFIENELEKHTNILCIRYNPWYYSDEVTLFHDFFENIAQKLGSLSSSNDLKTQIKKYGERISQISISKSATVNLAFLQFDVQADPPQSNSFIDLLKAKKKIQEMLKVHNVRIVVLMDDIDRLDKEEIQSILN